MMVVTGAVALHSADLVYAAGTGVRGNDRVEVRSGTARRQAGFRGRRVTIELPIQ